MGSRSKRRVRADGSSADGRTSKKAKDRLDYSTLADGISLDIAPVSSEVIKAVRERYNTLLSTPPDLLKAAIIEAIADLPFGRSDVADAMVRLGAFDKALSTANPAFLRALETSLDRSVVAAIATHPVSYSNSLNTASFCDLVKVYDRISAEDLEEAVADFRLLWAVEEARADAS